VAGKLMGYPDEESGTPFLKSTELATEAGPPPADII